MTQKLVALYNTLGLIKTEGDSTIRMADCLKFVQQMIEDEQKKENEEKSEATTEQEA